MSLALLQIAIVGNLQILPANASYGLLLPILYLIGIVGFFIPCLLMVAELAGDTVTRVGLCQWACLFMCDCVLD